MVIGSNLNSQLKLLFYQLVTTNNNLLLNKGVHKGMEWNKIIIKEWDGMKCI